MPDLPWRKWYPQFWLADPGLCRCEPASRGIWADAVNIMLLENKDRIEGTDEELARMCRCRVPQFVSCIIDLKRHNVGAITHANGCTILICRRLTRELEISNLRSKAAHRRWCKQDANAHAKPMHVHDARSPSPSCTLSSSVQDRGPGEGSAVELPHGFPKTEAEAKALSQFIGCPEEFAVKTWNKAMSRSGHDSKDVPITSFRHYLATEWAYQQERFVKDSNYGKPTTKPVIGSKPNPGSRF